MAFTVELLYRLLEALAGLLIHPLFYLGIALIILQYRRQILLERKLFHARLHHLAGETFRFLLCGLAAGVGASAVMAIFGAALTEEAILLMWGMSLVLILFRIRFLCLAYAAGALGIVKALLEGFPALREWGPIDQLGGWLGQTDVPALLVLAGVLHLAEALLIRWQGTRTASPLFIEGKRGKIVGGFHLYGFWPVPLFLLVPVSMGPLDLPWTPLFGTEYGSAGWTVMTFPAVLGFAERTLSRLPQAKVKQSSGRLLLYAAAVIVTALLSSFWPILLLPASLVAIGLHELLIWLSASEEEKSTPLFVHDSRGLKVLAVLPDSPAAELGIKTGEIIQRVNGVPVRTKEELHQAIRINPAFCRMEILNLEGELRFVNRPIYDGDHHQLGILLCPDEQARYYVEEKQRISLISYLTGRGAAEKRTPGSL